LRAKLADVDVDVDEVLVLLSQYIVYVARKVGYLKVCSTLVIEVKVKPGPHYATMSKQHCRSNRQLCCLLLRQCCCCGTLFRYRYV